MASWPWRQATGALAVLVAALLIGGSFVLGMALQTSIVQFLIPPYSYICLGLAVIALVEAEESRGRRVFMALALVALVILHVFGYAAGGVAPLLILGVQMGLLLGWVAWPRRAGWTLLWLAETSVWIGIAWSQGRLPL
jgi:hypothetical protein